MITTTQETIALIEHILSLFSTWITMYFNNNTNIQVLAFMDMLQHVIKVIRIYVYNFELVDAPTWFCNVHAFFNYFSHNCVISLSCVIIFNLYAAIKYPIPFSKYHKKIRPWVYLFITGYIGVFVFAALYEPLFAPYTPAQLENRHNCSSAYRYKLYQYVLTSPINNLPFILPAIYCTGYIIYKISITPRSLIKKQITSQTKISFSRWIKILFIFFALAMLSFMNLYSDLKNGMNAEKGQGEIEKIGLTYFLTATSGILIMIFTVSHHKIKVKLGIKTSNNYTSGYGVRSSFIYSNNQSKTNSFYFSGSNSVLQNSILQNNSSFHNSMILNNNNNNNNYNHNHNSFIIGSPISHSIINISSSSIINNTQSDDHELLIKNKKILDYESDSLNQNSDEINNDPSSNGNANDFDNNNTDNCNVDAEDDKKNKTESNSESESVIINTKTISFLLPASINDTTHYSVIIHIDDTINNTDTTSNVTTSTTTNTTNINTNNNNNSNTDTTITITNNTDTNNEVVINGNNINNGDNTNDIIISSNINNDANGNDNNSNDDNNNNDNSNKDNSNKDNSNKDNNNKDKDNKDDNNSN